MANKNNFPKRYGVYSSRKDDDEEEKQADSILEKYGIASNRSSGQDMSDGDDILTKYGLTPIRGTGVKNPTTEQSARNAIIDYGIKTDEMNRYISQNPYDPSDNIMRYYRNQAKRAPSDVDQYIQALTAAGVGSDSPYLQSLEAIKQNYANVGSYLDEQYRQTDEYKMINFDLEAGQKEIDRLKQKEAERNSLRSQLNFLQTGGGSAGSYAAASGMYTDDERKSEINRLQGELAPYANVDTELEQAQSMKYYSENLQKYNEVQNRDDFSENSQYKPTGENGWWNQAFNFSDYATKTYELINNMDDAKSSLGNGFYSLDQVSGYHYDLMEPEERKMFNYLFNTQGKEAASEYLDYIQPELNRRNMQNIADQEKAYAQQNFGTGLLASIGSVPNSLAGGLGALDVTLQKIQRDITGEYKPIDYNTNAMIPSIKAASARQAVGESITNATGVIQISEEEHPILAKVLNGKSLADVYNLGMSIADSAAAALLTKGLGKIGVPQKLASGLGSSLLGGNAASQGMIEAVANGATDEQALQLGLMNGLYESLFEAVSIDNLTKDTATGFFKTMLKQGGVEASEEAMTTIANTFADIAIMAENSGYEKSIAAYMEQGMSREEAEKKAFLDSVVQVGWDAFGGFLSGGVSAGGKYAIGSAIQNIQTNEQNKAFYGDYTGSIISDAMELSPDNKFVQSMQQKQADGKELSGREITRLMSENQKATYNAEAGEVRAAAVDSLNDLGETGDVEAIADAITKQVTGKKLTMREKSVISESQFGSRVASELSAYEFSPTNYYADIIERIANGSVNPDNFQKAEINQKDAPSVSTASENSAQFTMVNPDTAADASEPVPGSIQDLEQSSDEPVSIDEVAQKYGAQSSYVKKIYNIGSNQDVKQFDSAFERVFNYAQSGTVRLDVVKKLESIRSVLTDKQIELAYETGTAAANTAAQNLEAHNLAQASGKNGRKTGVVKGEGISIEDLKKTFNDTQNIAYKLLSTYAEATGIDIVLYQSEMDASGNFQGAQGRFKRGEPGTIYIDINAGLNGKHDVGNLAKYTMLRTFAHEFTHFIEKWNPMRYNEFRKVVFDTLRERGENVDDLVEAKQAAGLSYDMASREVVAEAMTDILPDTHFVQNLAEKHKSIFQKLMEKLKEFVEGLRSYFNSLGKNRSREANALKEQVGETVRYVENIVKMFDQVATQAVENYQLTVATEKTTEFAQEQNRENLEKGERYDEGTNGENSEKDSPGLVGEGSTKRSGSSLSKAEPAKSWKEIGGERQEQIVDCFDLYTYGSDEAELYLGKIAKGDISDEDIRREAVTEMARQFYEAMQGDRVLLENDGRFRWLGDMVGLLIEDVQAIQDGTFVADEFWEQEQRRDYIDEGYATDSTNWAYENFIIDETDRARFYEVIADLNKRNYSVPRNKNGVYMIEHNNKIMFTDGDFKAPTLSKVIVFDTNYDANMAYAKGLIFDEERRTAGHGEALRAIEDLFGEGYVSEYNSKIYKPDAWKNRGREREDGRGFDQEVQDQERTSPLTDRDVLEAAANDIGISDMSDAEQAALQTFKDRLTELHKLQEKRAEAGRLYKEQQFGANVDRQAAAQTLERMHILDDQIKTASVAVLDVEQKSVLQRVLKKARKVVEQQERDRSQAVLKRWRDRRNNAEVIKKYRSRIQKDVLEISGWATNPDGKNAVKHIPEVIRSSVIPFLTSIDFSSKSTLSQKAPTYSDYKFSELFEKLKNSIGEYTAENLYSGYADLPLDFMDRLNAFSNSIANFVKTEDSFVINQMDSQQLKALSEIIVNLKTFIQKFNRFHNNAMFRHAYEAGDNTIKFLRSFNKKFNQKSKLGVVSNFMQWQVIRPVFGFDRFGDGGVSIFQEFMAADDKFFKNAQMLFDFVKKTYTEKEAKEWTSTIKTFELESKESVSMPVTFVMSFYCLYKQEASQRHIEGDGIRVATFKKDGEPDPITHDGCILTENDISAILDSLTERQKEVADEIQQFMAMVGSDWGNYVSVARYGEKLFRNPDYFPINADGRNFEATADKQPGVAALYALLNASFTKQRNDKASNRIIVYDIFDVFSNHMARMAQYNAYALPIIDALKWLNYKETKTVQEVTKTGKVKEKVVTTDTLRTQLAKVFGMPVESSGQGKQGYAESFIVNLIKDISGSGPHGTEFDTAGKKFLNRYNRSRVGFNGRVVVQQPVSIIRAAEVISYNSILNAMRSPSVVFKVKKEMLENSGVAYWKSAGFFDVNISKNLVAMMKYESSAVDKITDKAMYLASKADEITWQTLWLACKYEVAKSGIKPSDAKFMEAVNRKFQEVIYRTQVVDSVLVKGEFLRDKGLYAKAAGSFMTESTASYSLLVAANDKIKMEMMRGVKFSDSFKKHRKAIVRTAGVYSLGALLISITTGIYDALRDDDDYQTFMEKWYSAFGGNLVGEIMPFNKIPVVADVYDLVKDLLSRVGILDSYGIAPQRIHMQWYDQLVDAVEILHDRISGEKTNYQWYGGVYKLLDAVSGITGLSIAPLTREAVTIWNNTAGKFNPDLKLKTYEMSKESEIKYAYLDGFLTFDEAVAELLASGKADDNDDAYWTVTRWYHEKENPDDEFSRFGKYFDAVKSGKSTEESLDELFSHGYEEKEIQSALKSEVKKWFQAEEISKDKVSSLLKTHTEMEDDEISKIITKWSCYLATGTHFEEITDKYQEKEITLNKAIEMYRKYGSYTEDTRSGLVSHWSPILQEEYENGKLSRQEVKSLYTKYFWYSSEEAESAVLKYDCEIDTGIAFNDIKDKFVKNKISHSRAVSLYTKYGEYEAEDAEKLVTKWECKKYEKFEYDEMPDKFKDGEINREKAKQVYIKYGGYDEDEAEEEVVVLEFVKENPACDGISYAAVSGYNDYCKRTGVNPATFYDVWKFKNDAGSDYDVDGEVTVSKKEKVMDYIDGLNLTKSQKDSLYYACGYAESTLNKTPWH